MSHWTETTTPNLWSRQHSKRWPLSRKTLDFTKSLWLRGQFISTKIQTYKRFKRTLIYYDTDTQSANVRGNPLCQATKRHLTVKRLKTMKNEMLNLSLFLGWVVVFLSSAWKIVGMTSNLPSRSCQQSSKYWTRKEQLNPKKKKKKKKKRQVYHLIVHRF